MSHSLRAELKDTSIYIFTFANFSFWIFTESICYRMWLQLRIAWTSALHMNVDIVDLYVLESGPETDQIIAILFSGVTRTNQLSNGTP